MTSINIKSYKNCSDGLTKVIVMINSIVLVITVLGLANGQEGCQPKSGQLGPSDITGQHLEVVGCNNSFFQINILDIEEPNVHNFSVTIKDLKTNKRIVKLNAKTLKRAINLNRLAFASKTSGVVFEGSDFPFKIGYVEQPFNQTSSSIDYGEGSVMYPEMPTNLGLKQELKGSNDEQELTVYPIKCVIPIDF